MACKDCVAEFGADKNRVIVKAGRCHTHHIRFKRKQAKDRHDKRVQKVYGLLAGEYDELHAFQNGRCAICRRATGRTRKLSVDHDHKTGDVRGLLCRLCNDLLGHIRDDIAIALRIVAYLSNPPMRRMKMGLTWSTHAEDVQTDGLE